MTSPTLGQMFGSLADAGDEAEEVLAAMRAGTIDLSEAKRRVTRAGQKVAAVGRATRGRATAADIAIIAPRAAPAAVDASPSSTDAVEIVSLSVGKVRTDGGTQPRDHLSKEVVERYVEAMTSGARFPPIRVYYDGSDYWLGDGFHRLTSARACGLAEIEAEVHQGTRRDAVLFSVGANATHGYPRSNADKRRAVLTLLRDEEWSAWNDREIARRCAVTHPFVAKLRDDLAPPSGNGFQMDRPRLVNRGGTVYHQKTANIGRSPSPPRTVDRSYSQVPTQPDDTDPAPEPADEAAAPAGPQEPDAPTAPVVDLAFVAEHKSAAGAIAYRLCDLARLLTLPPETVIACSNHSRDELRVAVDQLAEWTAKATDLLR
jgi:hypothetical protein